MNIKRRYNATYRARKKGYKIDTKHKILFFVREERGLTELRILEREFYYNIQLCLPWANIKTHNHDRD